MAKKIFLSPFRQILSPFDFRITAFDFLFSEVLNFRGLQSRVFPLYLMTNLRMVEPRSVRTLIKYTPAER